MPLTRNREPYVGPIVSLAEARGGGLKRYFTGIPCRNGHVCERKTAGCSCLYCNYDHNIRYLSEKPEVMAAHHARASAGLVVPMAARSARAAKKREETPEWWKTPHVRVLSPEGRTRKNRLARERRAVRNLDRVPVVRPRQSPEDRARCQAENAKKRRQRMREDGTWFSPEEVGKRRLRKQRAKKARAKEKKQPKVAKGRRPNNVKRGNPSASDVSSARYRKANHRAQKKGATGLHTKADMDEIFLKQKKRCALCGLRLAEKDRSNDHIVPLSRGGSNDRTNMQVVHFLCNSIKRDLDPIDHIQMITRDLVQPKFL